MKKLLGVMVLLLVGCTYSTGQRVGTVIKFSKKGWVCSTYEGELILGGNVQMLPSARSWLFSVKDEQVAQKIDSLQGKDVKLHYEQIKFRMPCTGETEYFVTGVEEVK